MNISARLGVRDMSMFHVKHRLLIALCAVVFALALVGCGAVASPRGWSAPVRAGDTVLLQTERGKITALRAAPGQQPTAAWTYPADGEQRPKLRAIYATPIIEGNTVFVAGYSGDVVALDLNTGRPVSSWPGPVNVGGQIVATPGWDGRTLYVADETGAVRTIEAANGAVGQQFLHIGERIWGRPAVSEGVVYLGGLDSKLRALANNDKRLLWTRDLGGAVAGDPLAEDGVVFAGTLDSTLYALNTSDGGTRWRFEGDGWFWARPLVRPDTDTVYAATIEGSVYAIDTNTGALRWRFHEVDSEIRGAPAIVGDTLVVATRDGEIIGIDAATGARRWLTERVGERFLADPLVLESDILLLNTSGQLLRVRPNDQGAADVIYRRS